MKQFTLFLAVLSLIQTTTGFAEVTIKGVTICAAKCNSESLHHLSHDKAIIGTLYYAKATEDNLHNSSVCLSESNALQLFSDRLSDDALKSCSDALLGKYFGKIVDLSNYSISESQK